MSEPEHKPFDARGYAADKIRAEQLELLIDQSYPAAYMSLVVAGLLVMILWSAQDHRTLLFWLGAAAPLPMPGGELVVTASLGVTEGNSGVGELMQQADTALYLAKANGPVPGGTIPAGRGRAGGAERGDGVKTATPAEPACALPGRTHAQSND